MRWINRTLISAIFINEVKGIIKKDDYWHYFKDIKNYEDLPDPAKCDETKEEFDLYTSMMLWNTEQHQWEHAI